MGSRTPGTPLIVSTLKEFADWVRARFGERVSDLCLFGSWARGEATEESDVDVLVVIEGLTSDELYAVVARSAEIATARNVLLRPLVMSGDEYEALRRGDRLLYREIARDGAPL